MYASMHQIFLKSVLSTSLHLALSSEQNKTCLAPSLPRLPAPIPLSTSSSQPSWLFASFPHLRSCFIKIARLSEYQIVRLSHHCLYPRVAISLPVDHSKSPLTNSSFPDHVKVVPVYFIRHLPELPQLLPGQQLCAHFRAEVPLPPTRPDIHKHCPGRL